MPKNYDVIVVGGGVAGISAAIAARRLGASTLLIEKNMMPGGVLTSSLVMPMMTFHSESRQTIKGIGQEIVDRLIEVKGSYGHTPDPIGFVKTITLFEPEKMKSVLTKFLFEEKIDYLFGNIVGDIKVENGFIRELILVNQSGKSTVRGSVFIDATGDGNLAIRSGAPYTIGNGTKETCQPMTLSMRVADVDKSKIKSYITKHPEEFVLSDGDSSVLAVSGFFKHVLKFEKYGINFRRDRLLFFEVPFTSGDVLMNTTRYSGYGGDAEELTEAQSLGNLGVWNFMEFLRNEIPGFENARLIQTGSSIGVRETTHVEADYCISIKDLLKCRKYDDCIAVSSYPVDVHLPSSSEIKTLRLPSPGESQVPLRALIPKDLNNVLLAGRTLSADHLAFSALRTSPLATATGMASGICAALALSKGNEVRKVKTTNIQDEIIRRDGVL